MYQSITLDRLTELALFATPTELERIVVETAKTNGIQVKAMGAGWWIAWPTLGCAGLYGMLELHM